MRPRLTSWLAVFLVLTLLCPHAGLADQPVDLLKAARVKAAYLYHLARLTTWPQASFTDGADSLRIDRKTGNRSVLSSVEVGAGEELRFPVEIAVEADGSVLVSDLASSAILRVDPRTGDRSIVTAPLVGSGDRIYTPGDMIVERSGAILVAELFLLLPIPLLRRQS